MNRTRLLMIGFVALALGAVVSFAVYRTCNHGAVVTLLRVWMSGRGQ